MDMETIAFIGIIIFVICDVAIYSMLTKRINALEKRYLKFADDSLKIMNGVLADTRTCVENGKALVDKYDRTMQRYENTVANESKDIADLDDMDEVYTKRLMSEPVTCIDIFGIPAMLIEYRDAAYKAWLEEHGWHRYELRGGRDDDPGLPCSIETGNVVVNWCGTVFTKEEILDSTEGEEYRAIGEDDFSYAEDSEISYEEFMDIWIKYCLNGEA